jgi:hypothetical protein
MGQVVMPTNFKEIQRVARRAPRRVARGKERICRFVENFFHGAAHPSDLFR